MSFYELEIDNLDYADVVEQVRVVLADALARGDPDSENLAQLLEMTSNRVVSKREFRDVAMGQLSNEGSVVKPLAPWLLSKTF